MSQKQSQPRGRLHYVWLTLLAVLLVAALTCSASYFWWRYQVNCAVEAALEKGSDQQWTFNPLESERKTDYILLLSDVDRVQDTLLETLATDASAARQINALETMKALLARSGSYKARERSLREILALLTSGRLRGGIKKNVLLTAADWIPSTGVTRQERAELIVMVRKLPELTPDWAKLLIAIGGRQEVLLVLQHGDTHDDNLRWAIHNSWLIGTRWPGILPYLKKWLEDPVIADGRVLGSSTLEFTTRGRRILLEYATDSSHPRKLRQRAIESLQTNLVGVGLLLDAAKDSETSRLLDEALGEDAIVALQASQASLRQYNADELWTELIEGLAATYWLPTSSGTPDPPEVKKLYEELSRENVKLSFRILERLTGKSDLQTQQEWRAWYLETNPGEVPQSQLVQLIIDHPELLASPTMLRRISPIKIGGIPPDCMPLYKEMLRDGPPYSKYEASRVLLRLSDDLEAVPVVIELIDNSVHSDSASVHPGEISLLQGRFAVNYYWDTDAWRKWWKVYKPKAMRETLYTELP